MTDKWYFLQIFKLLIFEINWNWHCHWRIIQALEKDLKEVFQYLLWFKKNPVNWKFMIKAQILILQLVIEESMAKDVSRDVHVKTTASVITWQGNVTVVVLLEKQETIVMKVSFPYLNVWKSLIRKFHCLWLFWENCFIHSNCSLSTPFLWV